MLYPLDIKQKIDFTSITDLLRKHCTFAIGREWVDQLTFLTDATAIRHLLAQVREMTDILSDASLAYPQCEMHDMRESLSRIRIEGLFLDEDELAHLRKALDALVLHLAFFHALPHERFPVLADWKPMPLIDENQQTLPQAPFADIIQSIDRILDKYGRLRDNASPELARIRRELTLAQGSVSRALQLILRKAQAEGIIDKDVAPTLREGRLVLPVPPAYKRKIGGIVHDESATGKTVYIEPQQVVEANNRIRELEGDEKRERIRILQDFASYLRPFAPAIRHAQDFLGEVDFLHAKALFAKQIKAVAPELLDYPMIDLKEARHPLLFLNFQKQNRTVVPLNLHLENDKVLIISGPNAGGKSVCLKTVALLQYMLQCGLPVPAREDTRMGIFRSILIDIGDQQSIEDDLSTYSSHLRNMKQFLRAADDNSLFLIDEFGGGTEPLLGGAIAEAVLQNLCEQGAFGIITTHYTNLKHFADSHQRVQNAAMLYDRGALKPLFQLSVGQPGSSFAIEIARQIGLPEQIILNAQQLIGEDNIRYDRSLQDIARDKRYWADKRKQVHEREKKLETLIAKYEEEMDDIKVKRREMLNKAKEEAAELLLQSNRTIERTIRDIREAQAEKQTTKVARQKISEMHEALTQEKPDNNTHKQRKNTPKKAPNKPVPDPADNTTDKSVIEVGACVRVAGQSAIGQVVSLTGKQAVIAFGNLKSTVPIKKLEYVSRNQAKKTAGKSPLTTQQQAFYASVSEALRAKKLAFSDQLDLRGLRADDALQQVINYIDDAIMVGASEVRILHGTGTGALKQVIRDYLKMQKRVADFHDGDPDKGGAGITIVEF